MIRHALPARPRPRTRPLYHTRLAATLGSGGVDEPFAYCKSIVQKHDYESYLCSHLFPHQFRAGYFALKAFFLELSMIQETVSQPVLGQMRFRFWRDAIRDIPQNKPPRHPIALALHTASKSANLQPYHLKRIIDARVRGLWARKTWTMESLNAHAESTYSTLLYLLLSLCDVPDASGALSHAASHLGVAQCIAVLLRALPFHASRGHLVIPAQVAAKHGVKQEEVFRSLRRDRRNAVHIKGLEDAVYDVAVMANDHLITARTMFAESGGKIPRGAMPVFVAGIPVSCYLTRLERSNFDAFHPSLQVRDWKLPWQVWRGFYKRIF